MSTIKDVARLAGVSPSTVSRVLSGNGPSAASEKTREKIWEAVRQTGYQANETARKLRKTASEAFGDSEDRADRCPTSLMRRKCPGISE